MNVVVMPDDEFNLKPINVVQKKPRASLPNEEIQKNIINNSELLKIERSKSLDPTQYEEFTAIGNLTGAVITSQVFEPNKINGKW